MQVKGKMVFASHIAQKHQIVATWDPTMPTEATGRTPLPMGRPSSRAHLGLGFIVHVPVTAPRLDDDGHSKSYTQTRDGNATTVEVTDSRITETMKDSPCVGSLGPATEASKKRRTFSKSSVLATSIP